MKFRFRLSTVLLLCVIVCLSVAHHPHGKSSEYLRSQVQEILIDKDGSRESLANAADNE